MATPFDYAQDRDTLHISVTDPMRHDIDAALAAVALVGALHSVDPSGADLAEQAHMPTDRPRPRPRYPVYGGDPQQFLKPAADAASATSLGGDHPITGDDAVPYPCGAMIARPAPFSSGTRRHEDSAHSMDVTTQP